MSKLSTNFEEKGSINGPKRSPNYCLFSLVHSVLQSECEVECVGIDYFVLTTEI